MSVETIRKLSEKYTKSTKADYWRGSAFEDVVKLTNDERGKWGEEVLFDWVNTHTNIPIEWDGDNNTDPDDGTYDLWTKSVEWTEYPSYVFNKNRIEKKTSGRTLSKGRPTGWQHENVYIDDKWDTLSFLDYDANDIIYLTIVKYDQLVVDGKFTLKIFGKEAHQRKNEEGKYKVDFSMKSIQNGIDAGVTFKYDLNNPDDEGLAKFLNDKLGE